MPLAAQSGRVEHTPRADPGASAPSKPPVRGGLGKGAPVVAPERLVRLLGLSVQGLDGWGLNPAKD